MNLKFLNLNKILRDLNLHQTLNNKKNKKFKNI